MPPNCALCERWSICECLKEYKDYESILYAVDDGDLVRADDCQLIELPPHGRLIDVDEPMTKISTMMQEPDYQHEGGGWMVGLIMARDAIDEAPTVIEAEE